MNVTRYHLIGLGLSAYQATQLTKPCAVQGKGGRQNLYNVNDVIEQIDTQLERRIRKVTKAALHEAMKSLRSMQGSVVPLPFGAAENETSSAVKHLMKSLDNPKTELHRMKALEIAGKHTAHGR